MEDVEDALVRLQTDDDNHDDGDGEDSGDDASDNEEEEEVGSARGSDHEDDSDDVSAALHRRYGPTGENGLDRLTGVRVVMSNGIGHIKQSKSRRSPGEHVPLAAAEGDPKRRDLVAMGVRYAAGLVCSPQCHIRDGRAPAPEYQLAQHTVLAPRSQGWARRPPHGQTLGATYIHAYQRDVLRMFNRGAETSSRKTSPAQMREELKKLYPGRFCIPSRAELRTRISALYSKAKELGVKVLPLDSATNSSAPRRRGRRSHLPAEVNKAIVAMVHADPAIKPTAGLEKIRDQFPDMEVDELTDRRIKSKVSAVKSNFKDRAKKL